MLEKEVFPQAYVMGVTWEQFWKLNPRKLDSIFAGYKAKLKEDDYKNWLNGIYTQSAVFVSIDIALNGRKSKSKYLKRPLLEEMENQQNMSEEEMQKQRELFVAKLLAMQANFNINHGEKSKNEQESN